MSNQLRTSTAPKGRRVFSEDTSYKMRALLRLVVTDGTGRKADAPGYFWGQCAELCGESHAVMRFRVIAHTTAPTNVSKKMTRPTSAQVARSASSMAL